MGKCYLDGRIGRVKEYIYSKQIIGGRVFPGRHFWGLGFAPKYVTF